MDERIFFDVVRFSLFKGAMEQAQVNGIRTILRACDAHSVFDQEERAYILATAYWETNRTLRPVKEAYWLSEGWRLRNLRYSPYYGRGYVQLTWKANYATMGKLLGLPLVGRPDLAMKEETAAAILVIGMKNGLFSPKAGPLAKYLGENVTDWLNARRTVNGTDKRVAIADIAKKFNSALAEASSTSPTNIRPEKVLGTTGLLKSILLFLSAIFKRKA